MELQKQYNVLTKGLAIAFVIGMIVLIGYLIHNGGIHG